MDAVYPGALDQVGCTHSDTITGAIWNVIEGSFTAQVPQTAVAVTIYVCGSADWGLIGQLIIVEDGHIVLHKQGFGWLEGIVDTNGDGLSELISSYRYAGSGPEEFSASLHAYEDGELREIENLGSGTRNCHRDKHGRYTAFSIYYKPTNNGEYPIFEQEHHVASCGS